MGFRPLCWCVFHPLHCILRFKAFLKGGATVSSMPMAVAARLYEAPQDRYSVEWPPHTHELIVETLEAAGKERKISPEDGWPPSEIGNALGQPAHNLCQ
jgi:hypothetical protein